jgi:hypothetical protein
MKHYLMVDDLRSIETVASFVNLETDSFRIDVARTFAEARELLENSVHGIHCQYDVLFLDHDLGLGKTGYDLLLELIDGCYSDVGEPVLRKVHSMPKKIICISANPVGIKNIEFLCAKLEDLRVECERLYTNAKF